STVQRTPAQLHGRVHRPAGPGPAGLAVVGDPYAGGRGLDRLVGPGQVLANLRHRSAAQVDVVVPAVVAQRVSVRCDVADQIRVRLGQLARSEEHTSELQSRENI